MMDLFTRVMDLLGSSWDCGIAFALFTLHAKVEKGRKLDGMIIGIAEFIPNNSDCKKGSNVGPLITT